MDEMGIRTLFSNPVRLQTITTFSSKNPQNSDSYLKSGFKLTLAMAGQLGAKVGRGAIRVGIVLLAPTYLKPKPDLQHLNFAPLA
jgi:hypothetical protein